MNEAVSEQQAAERTARIDIVTADGTYTPVAVTSQELDELLERYVDDAPVLVAGDMPGKPPVVPHVYSGYVLNLLETWRAVPDFTLQEYQDFFVETTLRLSKLVAMADKTPLSDVFADGVGPAFPPDSMEARLAAFITNAHAAAAT